MVIDQHYSVSRVASILGVTPATLRTWIRDGKVSAVQIQRNIRIAHSELERLLDAAKVDASR